MCEQGGTLLGHLHFWLVMYPCLNHIVQVSMGNDIHEIGEIP